MNDLISRKAVLDELSKYKDRVSYLYPIIYQDVCADIESLPSIDAVPVRHGTWTRVGDNSYKCSECGEVSCCFADYCPDCGADMRKQKLQYGDEDTSQCGLMSAT